VSAGWRESKGKPKQDYCVSSRRKDGNSVAFVEVVKGVLRRVKDTRQLVLYVEGDKEILLYDGCHSTADRDYFLVKTEYVKYDNSYIQSLLSFDFNIQTEPEPDKVLTEEEAFVVSYMKQYKCVLDIKQRLNWRT